MSTAQTLLGIVSLAILPPLLWLIMRRPENGVALLVLTYPLANHAIELPFANLSVSNVLLMVMGFGLFLRASRLRGQVRVPHIFIIVLPFLIWYLVASLISILVALYPMAAARYFVTRIGYVMTVLVILYSIDNLEKTQKILRMLVISAAVSGLVTIIGALAPEALPSFIVRHDFQDPVFPYLGTPRTVGLFLNYHSFGTWATYALSVALLAVFWPASFRIRRGVAIVVVLILILAAAVSQTRAAWLAFVLVVLLGAFYVYAVSRHGPRRPVIVLGGILLFLVALIADSYLRDVYVSTVLWRMGSIQERLTVYQIGWEMFQSSPLLGVGPMDERFSELPAQGLRGLHNGFLVELAASGIVGFVPYVALIILALATSFVRMTRQGSDSVIAAGILIAMIGGFVSLSFYIGIGEKSPWILLALAISLTRSESPSKSGKIRPMQVSHGGVGIGSA